MRKQTLKIGAVIFLAFMLTVVSAFAAQSGAASKQSTEKSVLLNRIDFGNSYIMGQSIKSGAVYLLQRKKSEINSMLKYRTDYRSEILEDFEITEPASDKKNVPGKP
jgi:hypothetical protein